MKQLLEAITQSLNHNESLVLATLFARSGSAPRAAGAGMLVRADGTIAGTVGGGLLEARVRQIAPELFRTHGAIVMEFDLSGDQASQTDMICGGQVQVLASFIDAESSQQVEPFRQALHSLRRSEKAWFITELPLPGQVGRSARRWLARQDGEVFGQAGLGLAVTVGHGSPIGLFSSQADRSEPSVDLASAKQPAVVDAGTRRFLVEPVFSGGTVYIFGAGHVSTHLAPLCTLVGFETVVLDDRPEYANAQRFSSADRIIVVDAFDQAFAELAIDADSYLVIVTRGHVHDATVLGQGLRTTAGYIGMIGSVRKRDAVYRNLNKQGFAASDFARVHSPIGLAIGAESPEEIAISIVAELIKARSELH